MAFFLRKAVELLLLPIGLCSILTVAGLLLRRRWLIVAGVIVLLGFSMPITARLLRLPLEDVYAPKRIDQCPTADAIVVLSGNTVRGIAAPGVQWGEGANRYFTGVNLALAGKAKTLVFTGAPLDQQNTEGSIERQAAIDQGVASDRIVVTGRVLTTADEARAVSAMPGIHSVVLVTSAFHMPRAAMLFRAVGLQVIPFPTDLSYSSGPFPFSVLPSAQPLSESQSALREYYGLAMYRLILFFHRPARVTGAGRISQPALSTP